MKNRGTRMMTNQGKLKQVTASTPVTPNKQARKMLSMKGNESSIVYMSLEMRLMIRPRGVMSKNRSDAF